MDISEMLYTLLVLQKKKCHSIKDTVNILLDIFIENKNITLRAIEYCENTVPNKFASYRYDSLIIRKMSQHQNKKVVIKLRKSHHLTEYEYTYSDEQHIIMKNESLLKHI